MFLCLCLACSRPDDRTPLNELDAHTRYELRSVRACAVLADDSPHDPYRLVFLHRTNPDGVDAQAELFAFSGGAGSASGGDTSKFRCGEVRLALQPGTDRTPVYMDFIPGVDAVKIRELRVYRFDAAWNPEDPFAVATEDHQPFRDYVFRVNLVMPPFADDPATLFVR